MIQINNFLIKREQSQARLSFAKREKSRLLAKTILTLVALLAVTLFTGLSASAQNLTLKLSDALYDQENYTYYAYNDGDKSIAEGTYVQINMSTYHTQVMNIYMNGEVVYTKPSGDVYTNDVYHFTAGPNCKILGGISNRFDWESNPNIYITMDASVAASGPKVAWDKDKKTGKFTMPGGNVTLEPEYYPQATVADGGVTAADADARATTDDPLVKVDATKLTGAKKLMYFVSNSGTTAPVYDAEGWTDQLPTAEGFTQQGIVYVWYYPVGIDEGVDGATATYSDGDICLQSITARIAPEPTYAVTFAEGTDPNEWTADPAADVTKGQTVTVTYTGAKKVVGVKAEKKAEAPAVKITSFSLQGPSSLDASDYATISIVNIVPSNATNQTFTWSTSGDISIFEVSNETKTCVVRSGENVGEASVTATANDGSGVSYTLNITIIGDN